MSAVTSLLRQAREDMAREICDDLVASVRRAKARHGPDPEIDFVVMAAIGSALDLLKMCGSAEAARLGECLIEDWLHLKTTGKPRR